VIDTLVLAFASDPFCRWIWPEPKTFLTAFGKLLNPFGGEAFETETAFVTDDCRAAALWLPPGTASDSEAMEMIVGESVAPERLEEIGTVMEMTDQVHPKEEHWYLPVIGCDPAFVGKGLGGALLTKALEHVDESGLPAYLESSNPRNISLYLRHGFEIIGEIQHGSSPVMTPMMRAAR
jgi:ribosomal protein S18 acetylase RimI-like enzyme